MKEEDIDTKIMGFIKYAAGKIVEDKIKDHEHRLINDLLNYKIESPIEQLMYVALKLNIEIIGMHKDINEATTEISTRDRCVMEVFPQKSIGPYNVDFMLQIYLWPKGKKKEKFNEVIIECDSQQFHDRSEPERRYEKKRDRYLQSMGYRVLRYTGSEILKKPINTAYDAIGHLQEMLLKMSEKDNI